MISISGQHKHRAYFIHSQLGVHGRSAVRSRIGGTTAQGQALDTAPERQPAHGIRRRPLRHPNSPAPCFSSEVFVVGARRSASRIQTPLPPPPTPRARSPAETAGKHIQHGPVPQGKQRVEPQRRGDGQSRYGTRPRGLHGAKQCRSWAACTTTSQRLYCWGRAALESTSSLIVSIAIRPRAHITARLAAIYDLRNPSSRILTSFPLQVMHAPPLHQLVVEGPL